jgi:hypothetical protein
VVLFDSLNLKLVARPNEEKIHEERYHTRCQHGELESVILCVGSTRLGPRTQRWLSEHQDNPWADSHHGTQIFSRSGKEWDRVILLIDGCEMDGGRISSFLPQQEGNINANPKKRNSQS